MLKKTRESLDIYEIEQPLIHHKFYQIFVFLSMFDMNALEISKCRKP